MRVSPQPSPVRQDHGVFARHNKFGTFQVKIEQKTERANVQHGKLSPQKKAAVTKFKSAAHLLKWLAALCVLECVGAEVVSRPAAPSAPPTSLPSTDELEGLRTRTAKLEAVVVLHAAELDGGRGDKLEEIRQYAGMVPPS